MFNDKAIIWPKKWSKCFNFSLAEHECPVLTNSADPDQLASEAN